MKKTIGIFAHVDAGKTTFSEQLLFHTNSIRKKGRVDHKDSYLDNHYVERERGITVFSDIGIFNYKDDIYYLIDTPGHLDFSPEMERSIKVLDYAILLVSAAEGVQGHTETIWRMLRKHNVPVFIFINKIDREGADASSVINELHQKLNSDICFIKEEYIDEEAKEFIAERNEELLGLYLDNHITIEEIKEKVPNMIKNGEIFIAMEGSALLDIGVKKFLDLFHELTYTNYDDTGLFKGKVLKIKHDEKGNKLTFLKCLGGELVVKDIIDYKSKDKIYGEKVNEIRAYSGIKYELQNKIAAGDVFALVGLTNMRAGMGINIEDEYDIDMEPTLRAKVITKDNVNMKKLYVDFKELESEESTLGVVWNEEVQELSISVMGKIQLEVLKEIIEERYKLSIEFDNPEIIYKESIDGKVEGFGHFEPLKHYAEVHLLLEAAERGTGITFENKCHNDYLMVGQQNLVKTHLFEREHKGVLIGAGLTDIKVTLITGRSHIKHTEGGDFREATKRAIRQGLEKANNILLEPYYKIRLDIPMDLIGRALSDIQKYSGEICEQISYGERIIIIAIGPVKEFMNYPIEFQTYTKGKGNISMVFNGYDICHNRDEVIEEKAYDRNSDIEYSSSSIFCSKGEGFVVPWNKVEEYMHCLK